MNTDFKKTKDLCSSLQIEFEIINTEHTKSIRFIVDGRHKKISGYFDFMADFDFDIVTEKFIKINIFR